MRLIQQLVLLALALFFQSGSALTSDANINSLERLYNTTQGESWDLVSLQVAITSAGYQFMGIEPWNFTRYNGQLVNDPCSSSFWAGLVCDCFYSPCRIVYMFLNSASLQGYIPAEIGNLTDLTNLDLGFNEITGPIPFEIGKLNQLNYLSLSSNQISGQIGADWISNLTLLSILRMDTNLLDGPIPDSIGNLTKLTDLILGHNQFQGL